MIIENIHITSKRFITAISGGSDSLCLTMLANDFAIANNAKMCAVFVNHMLREESSREIEDTIAVLQKYNINYHVLYWHHDNITGSIENKARIARYQLLYQYCKDQGYDAIVTGHHKLDNWETFFMRLSKGSGLTGLTAIKNERYLHDIKIIRPLLHYYPNDMKETLNKKFGITKFVHDSMNDDLKYERVRWRRSYDDLAKYGIDADSIEKTVERLQLSDDCLNEVAKKYYLICFNGQYIIKNIFKILHLEIRMRILKMITKSDIISYELLKRAATLFVQSDFTSFNMCGYVFSNGKNIKVQKENRNEKKH